MIFADTHVVAWLYAGLTERLGAGAARLLDRETVRISPMVELELQYLFEIGRTTTQGQIVVTELQRTLGLVIDDTPFVEVVTAAHSMAWTRDPFDRLITAQASLGQSTLLTADETIAAHYPAVVWA